MKPTAVWITGTYDANANHPEQGTDFRTCSREMATHVSVCLVDDDHAEPMQDLELGESVNSAYADALIFAAQLSNKYDLPIRNTFHKVVKTDEGSPAEQPGRKLLGYVYDSLSPLGAGDRCYVYGDPANGRTQAVYVGLVESKPTYPQVQMVRGHKHTCANVQPGSTAADVCDCGAVVDGKSIPVERPLRVTGHMFNVFVDAIRLQGNESETVRDLIMNGLEEVLKWLPEERPIRKALIAKHAELIKERDELRRLLREAIQFQPGEIDLPAWLEMQAEVEKILPCVDEGCPQAGSEHVCTTTAKAQQPGPWPPKPDLRETSKYVEPGMLKSRYLHLQHGDGTLTPEEVKSGWFFDDDYDGLLAHTSWPGHRKDRP